jgi:signal peptidase II
MRYYKRLALVAVLVIVIDQICKWWLISLMAANDFGTIPVTSFFNIVMVWNKGVSFGLFSQIDARIPLIIMSFIVCICLIWWYRKTNRLGVSMVVGGAIGNVIDRLHYGAVADFFDFHLAQHHWPAFNIADMCIVIGVFLLILHEFKQKNTI